ncbi:hypothetical protein [Vibrio rotiferianus]|uniref:hypothetical protein n=1 Tax=Vibrio rotiferianus TaxID=190895 RepID=UPI00391DC540
MTQGDVLEAVENGQLPLCASIEANQMGALIKRGDKWVICAIFGYKGIVRLFPDSSTKFASTLATQPIKQVIILEPEKITHWRDVEKVFSNITKSEYLFESQAPSKPNVMLGGYMHLETTTTIENFAGEIANVFSMAMPEEKREAFNKQFPKNNGMRLNTKAIDIEPERLRIDLNDIERVFGSRVLQASLTDHRVQNKDTDFSLPLTHPIEEIVFRVLQHAPNANVRQVWKMLRQEISNDNEPTFDIDAIITEMTPDTIYWAGTGSDEKSMGYESFRKNTLVTVKRHIKNANESTEKQK